MEKPTCPYIVLEKIAEDNLNPIVTIIVPE